MDCKGSGSLPTGEATYLPPEKLDSLSPMYWEEVPFSFAEPFSKVPPVDQSSRSSGPSQAPKRDWLRWIILVTDLVMRVVMLRRKR